MESWSYVSEGKGFVSDEAISGKKGFMDWELKTPCSYGSNIVVPDQDSIENQGFVRLGFPEMRRKLFSNHSIGDVLSSSGGGRMVNPIGSTPNAFSGEEESSSKLSSSVVESNSRDSSLIDLKLGGFADHREAHIIDLVEKNTIVSASESSMPAKRVRAMGSSSSHTPYCQVQGCKKDLSSCKDYHKRHKVCEIHSKTPKVIVNGMEQRFCQQCSRFHLLPEFDDGKRSCRKRLAGHNERRRKPHVGGLHSGRTGKVFQPYNGSAGSRFQGTPLTATSFICQDILPRSLMHSQNSETNDWGRNMKMEDGADYSPQSAISIRNGHLHPKSILPCYSFEKQCAAFQLNGVNTAATGTFNVNNYQYPNDLMGSSTLLGSEDFTGFESASTVRGLREISDSGRALSLLSSLSQNSSRHSSRIPMAHPLIIPHNHVHNDASHMSGRISGVGLQASGAPTKFQLPEMNSSEENHSGPIIISDDSDVINFGITDGVFQGSEYMNVKDRLSCEHGPTIDLLQLSSQLQQVEHQRQFMQVKQENDAFYGHTIT